MKKFTAWFLAFVILAGVFVFPPVAAPVEANAQTENFELVSFGEREWRVLEIKDGHALLLHETVITGHPYHAEREDITWENSTSRAWLNGEFFNDFSEEDRAKIRDTNVINNDNPWWNTIPGGNNTTDKIFSLSIEEVAEYFGCSELLELGKSTINRTPTNGLSVIGIFENNEISQSRIAKNAVGTASFWWLRSPGDKSTWAALVANDGHLFMVGISVDTIAETNFGLRPAMWVKLDSVVEPCDCKACGCDECFPPNGKCGVCENCDDSVVESCDCKVCGCDECFPPNGKCEVCENCDDSVVEPCDCKACGCEKCFPPNGKCFDCENCIALGAIVPFGASEWRVLDIDGNHALLLHETVITNHSYHAPGGNITWEESSSRAWLNGDFFSNNFSEKEKAKIRDTNVINDENPWTFSIFGFPNRTPGGNDTVDKIFSLSIEEVAKYFGVSELLEAGKDESNRDPANPLDGLNYAGIWENNEQRIAYNAAGAPSSWWLRSPGAIPSAAAVVGHDGSLAVLGYDVNTDSPEISQEVFPEFGLRPALWLKFSASSREEGDIIVPATNDGDAFINLTAETIFIPFAAAQYSTNGGRTWKKGAFPTGNAFKKLFNKELTLSVRSVRGGGTRIDFPKINKRPKANAEKLRAWYSPNTWTLRKKADKTNNVANPPALPIRAYEWARGETNGKIAAIPRWNVMPDAHDFEVATAVKGTKPAYFFRSTARKEIAENVIYTPASKPFRIRPAAFRKKLNLAINYKNETLKTKIGQEFSTDDGATWTPAPVNPDTGKAIRLDVSRFITEEKIILVRRETTGRKTRSENQEIIPLPRAVLAETLPFEFTVTNGKIDAQEISAFGVLIAENWKPVPRFNADSEKVYDIRVNPTAKKDKNGWSGDAASLAGTLTVEWGVVGQNSRGDIMGITRATITEHGQTPPPISQAAPNADDTEFFETTTESALR